MSVRVAASIGAVAVLLVAGCGSDAEPFAGSRRDPAPSVDSVELPTAGSGEPFEFRAADGEVLLVYFGYTSCPDVCPTTMADIARAKKALGEDGDRVELAMVTIDPDRDTDDVIQGYVEGFVADGVGLRSDDPAQLQAAADLFGVFFEVTTADDGDVEVLHSGSLFGVDADGLLVASWPFGTPASDLTSDLEQLIGEASA